MILGFKTINPKTKEPTNFVQKIMDGTKIHSIRQGNRWKPGMLIHAATGVRTKNYNRFKMLSVISVQNIVIHPTGLIMIDGAGLNEYTKSLLATNDGFYSLEDFFLWFDNYCNGQIIHWTNYRY